MTDWHRCKRINLNICSFFLLQDGDSVSYLKCGTISGAYSTVDFGTGFDVNSSFTAQRTYEAVGPLVKFRPLWQSKNLDQTISSDQPDQTCNHSISKDTWPFFSKLGNITETNKFILNIQESI
jgi:hypothetical protein